MPCYAPELTESVIDQYLHTDKPVGLIARDHAIDERDVTRIRHAAGLPPRRARVRSLPPAMAALAEARALLRAPAADEGRNQRREAERIAPDDAGGAALATPPPERGRSDCEAVRVGVNAQDDPSPPLRGDPPLSAEGGERTASAIDRIERLVEQELAAEEAGRAQFGLLPRAPADAERCARTLAILTKTLQALAHMRGGAAEQGFRHDDDDDDMPADIDEFRRDLARRIDAFVAAETHGQDAHSDSGAATLDEIR